MDITWLLVIAFVIGLGCWDKYQNTKHMRKLVKELKEKHHG